MSCKRTTANSDSFASSLACTSVSSRWLRFARRGMWLFAPVLHAPLRPPHTPPSVRVEHSFARVGQLALRCADPAQCVQQAFPTAAAQVQQCAHTPTVRLLSQKKHQEPRASYGSVKFSLSSSSCGTDLGLPPAPVGRDSRSFKLEFRSRVTCGEVGRPLPS
jgi:hypothetical protein